MEEVNENNNRDEEFQKLTHSIEQAIKKVAEDVASIQRLPIGNNQVSPELKKDLHNIQHFIQQFVEDTNEDTNKQDYELIEVEQPMIQHLEVKPFKDQEQLIRQLENEIQTVKENYKDVIAMVNEQRVECNNTEEVLQLQEISINEKKLQKKKLFVSIVAGVIITLLALNMIL